MTDTIRLKATIDKEARIKITDQDDREFSVQDGSGRVDRSYPVMSVDLEMPHSSWFYNPVVTVHIQIPLEVKD